MIQISKCWYSVILWKQLHELGLQKTNRFDSCLNADVTGKVDRFKHSPVIPLPVQGDDSCPECFCQGPSVILQMPKQNSSYDAQLFWAKSFMPTFSLGCKL